MKFNLQFYRFFHSSGWWTCDSRGLRVFPCRAYNCTVIKVVSMGHQFCQASSGYFRSAAHDSQPMLNDLLPRHGTIWNICFASCRIYFTSMGLRRMSSEGSKYFNRAEGAKKMCVVNYIGFKQIQHSVFSNTVKICRNTWTEIFFRNRLISRKNGIIKNGTRLFMSRFRTTELRIATFQKISGKNSTLQFLLAPHFGMMFRCMYSCR